MQRLITTHEATMIEFIDLPTCDPFFTTDCCGPSTRSERSFMPSIDENSNGVGRRDSAARNNSETLLIFPRDRAAIWHRIARRLWDGGGHIIARFPSWLGRLLSDVDVNDWPAPFH